MIAAPPVVALKVEPPPVPVELVAGPWGPSYLVSADRASWGASWARPIVSGPTDVAIAAGMSQAIGSGLWSWCTYGQTGHRPFARSASTARALADEALIAAGWRLL